ncbi:hypothetical protein [Haloferax sp. DFSO60]|uniref:hypothetical protein n=1 Tax=Haloferax sp. DFSO60 TaxID=3388652 RepID=UPI00397B1860
MDDELRLRLDALIFLLIVLFGFEGFQFGGFIGAVFGLVLAGGIVYTFGPGLETRD